MLTIPERKSRLVKRFSDSLELWEFGPERIIDFSYSIYQTYKKVYGGRHAWESGYFEFGQILQEDVELMHHAHFFGITSPDRTILCTGRVYARSPWILFPLEKIWDCNVLKIARNARAIYHGGRLTVNKLALKERGYPGATSVELFKRVHVYSMAALRPEPGDAFFGELDELALRVYRFLGIPTRVLAEPLDYMGSKTYPVRLAMSDIRPDHWLDDIFTVRD